MSLEDINAQKISLSEDCSEREAQYKSVEGKLASSAAQLTALQSELRVSQDNIAVLSAAHSVEVAKLSEAAAVHAAELQRTIDSLEVKLDLQGGQELELLTRAEERLAEMETENQRLEKALEDQRVDYGARIEAYNEKLKRLKALLAKSQKVGQERDAALAKVSSLKSRPSTISITARVDVGDEQWCLINEEKGALALSLEKNKEDRDENGPRWVLSHALSQWVEEGTNVSSDCGEALNVRWERAQSAVNAQHEEEKRLLSAELVDINEKFSAYKDRAQAALKRLR